jgi:hypothetical protein
MSNEVMCDEPDNLVVVIIIIIIIVVVVVVVGSISNNLYYIFPNSVQRIYRKMLLCVN